MSRQPGTAARPPAPRRLLYVRKTYPLLTRLKRAGQGTYFVACSGYHQRVERVWSAAGTKDARLRAACCKVAVPGSALAERSQIACEATEALQAAGRWCRWPHATRVKLSR